MYKCINGWTKSKMLKVVKARRYNCRSTEHDICAYLSSNGNKCALGLFIPNRHLGLQTSGNYHDLIRKCPDLLDKMPLTKSGMIKLQIVHDLCDESPYKGNAKAAMIDWIEKNVEE